MVRIPPIHKSFRSFGREQPHLGDLKNDGYWPLTNWEDPPSIGLSTINVTYKHIHTLGCFPTPTKYSFSKNDGDTYQASFPTVIGTLEHLGILASHLCKLCNFLDNIAVKHTQPAWTNNVKSNHFLKCVRLKHLYFPSFWKQPHANKDIKGITECSSIWVLPKIGVPPNHPF